MLADARERRFHIVLCKTQSRFTRDMELVEKYIHGLFPIWGIRFVAVADNADTAVKGNKKARQIAGLVNEWYLEDLSENIRMVLDMKRREGQYIGSSPVYGYRRDPSDRNHLVIDPEAAEVVRQIFRWSLQGHGQQRIAAMLNARGMESPRRYKEARGLDGKRHSTRDCGLWSKTAVCRILRNEMYAGVMVQGRTRKVSYKSKVQITVPEERWYRVEGTHEPIIDRSAFDAVQRGMALRTRRESGGAVHPLSGLVRCMDCGGAMSKTKNRGGRAYLRCRLSARSGAQCLCGHHAIRLDRLTECVSAEVRQYVRSSFDLSKAELRPGEDRRRAALKRERAALDAEAERRGAAIRTLYLDRVSGAITAEQFSELNGAFLQEKARLRKRIHEIEDTLSAERTSESRADLLRRAEELLKLETVPRALFTALIEEIRVGQRDPESGEQRVEIRWRF